MAVHSGGTTVATIVFEVMMPSGLVEIATEVYSEGDRMDVSDIDEEKGADDSGDDVNDNDDNDDGDKDNDEGDGDGDDNDDELVVKLVLGVAGVEIGGLEVGLLLERVQLLPQRVVKRNVSI